MKKLFAILTFVAVLFTLSSCGEQKSKDATHTTKASVEVKETLQQSKQEKTETQTTTLLTTTSLTTTPVYSYSPQTQKVQTTTKYVAPKKSTTTKTTTTTTSGEISRNRAVEIATLHAGVTSYFDLEVEKDFEKGAVVWEVSFDTQMYEYEYEIDAKSGTILHSHKERHDYD